MRNSPQVTVSYLILCHDSPERIIRLVMKILSEDETGHVLIHFDKNSPESAYEELCVNLKDTSRCTVLANRVKCGWGQWSLVEASLRMLEHALSNYKDDYYYLLSEYCYPVKPLSELKFFLTTNKGISFIECEPSSWIKGGIREDRYLYRHYFNKKKHPLLHKYSYKIQKKLLLKKEIPLNVSIKFGSQWWCLSNSAVSRILSNNELAKYFRYMWVPDESFFQSCVATFNMPYLNLTLTYYAFDSGGKAILFDEMSNIEEKKFFLRKFENLNII